LENYVDLLKCTVSFSTYKISKYNNQSKHRKQKLSVPKKSAVYTFMHASTVSVY